MESTVSHYADVPSGGVELWPLYSVVAPDAPA